MIRRALDVYKADPGPFFAGGNAGIQILKRGDLAGGPYATARGRTKEIAQRRAEEIADALNAAIENADRQWVGDGPTLEEAGGESILARYGEDLQRAQWSASAHAWVDDTGLPVARWEPSATGWRPMPKVRP